jgi:hypothetical protein
MLTGEKQQSKLLPTVLNQTMPVKDLVIKTEEEEVLMAPQEPQAPSSVSVAA